MSGCDCCDCGAGQEQAQDEDRATTPGDVLRDGADTYTTKNEDYGDSWRKVGETLFLMANEEPVTLHTAEDWIRVGLYTRRLDKFFRTFNGEFVADSLTYEGVDDNHVDEAVYAAMHAAQLRQEQGQEPTDG